MIDDPWLLYVKGRHQKNSWLAAQSSGGGYCQAKASFPGKESSLLQEEGEVWGFEARN